MGGWQQTDPGRPFAGRALTCAFMPFRADFNESVVREGRARGQLVGDRQNTWVIEALGPDDVFVADIFGKIFNGTVVGDNLGTAVASRTGVGAVIDGGVRDLRGLRELDANFYFRDSDPSPIRDVVLSSMNGPVTIGGTTVLPGDVVLGTELGVTFIPPHLVAAVVDESLTTAHRDRFGKLRLSERVYATTEIDTSAWAEHIEADYQEWTKINPVRPPSRTRQANDQRGDDHEGGRRAGAVGGERHYRLPPQPVADHRPQDRQPRRSAVPVLDHPAGDQPGSWDAETAHDRLWS